MEILFYARNLMNDVPTRTIESFYSPFPFLFSFKQIFNENARKIVDFFVSRTNEPVRNE